MKSGGVARLGVCLGVALGLAAGVVTAASPAAGVAGFGDVAEGRFFAEPVAWMVESDLTKGTAPGCFSPDDQATRAQAATFVYRHAGEPPAPPGAAVFDDVVAASFYDEPVGWMAANQITTGTTPSTFDPDRYVTRSEFATFLWRYAGKPAGPAGSAVFGDVIAGSFYDKPVGWMAANQITTGTTPSTFDPDRSITRGEIATFLWRFSGEPAASTAPEGAVCSLTGEREPSGHGGVPDGFEDVRIASMPQPTDLAWTPDGRTLVTGKNGELWVIDAGGTLLSTPAIDLGPSLCTNVERGLGGVTVHPDFGVSNNYIYLYFTYPKYGTCNELTPDSPVNRLSRFELPPSNIIDPATELIMMDTPWLRRSNHNGGDMEFGPDGYLYVTIGDGLWRFLADDADWLTGKIVRLTADGDIPPGGNAFDGPNSVRCNVDGVPPAGSPAGAQCQEIYTLGHRNPWRLAKDPTSPTPRFYVMEVGQNLWEEINEITVPGQDFGWTSRGGALRLLLDHGLRARGRQNRSDPLVRTSPRGWGRHHGRRVRAERHLARRVRGQVPLRRLRVRPHLPDGPRRPRLPALHSSHLAVSRHRVHRGQRAGGDGIRAARGNAGPLLPEVEPRRATTDRLRRRRQPRPRSSRHRHAALRPDTADRELRRGRELGSGSRPAHVLLGLQGRLAHRHLGHPVTPVHRRRGLQRRTHRRRRQRRGRHDDRARPTPATPRPCPSSSRRRPARSSRWGRF